MGEGVRPRSDDNWPRQAAAPVYVAYYWRIRPGRLDDYNDYIRGTAERIDAKSGPRCVDGGVASLDASETEAGVEGGRAGDCGRRGRAPPRVVRQVIAADWTTRPCRRTYRARDGSQ